MAMLNAEPLVSLCLEHQQRSTPDDVVIVLKVKPLLLAL